MAARPRPTQKDEPIYPVYVVFGKDRRQVTDKVEEVLGEVLAGCERQVSLSSYDGDEAVLSEVLDGLRTLPFLSPRRAVLVKDADGFVSEHRQSLEKYLEEPGPTGVLVLMVQSFPKNTRLAKRVNDIGKVYNCEPIKAQALPGYVSDYARRKFNVRLMPEAAELLVELAGEDTGLLCGEIDKLTTYVADPEKKRNVITPADVEALVGHNRQFNVFNVIDAMTAGETDKALVRLDLMLQQDREAQYKAVGAFAWHFRRLYQGRLLQQQGVNEYEITRQFRVWSHKDAFIEQIKKLKIEEIGACLQQLMKIDRAVKSGAGTVRMGLEKMIVQFCRRTKSMVKN